MLPMRPCYTTPKTEFPVSPSTIDTLVSPITSPSSYHHIQESTHQTHFPQPIHSDHPTKTNRRHSIHDIQQLVKKVVVISGSFMICVMSTSLIRVSQKKGVAGKFTSEFQAPFSDF